MEKLQKEWTMGCLGVLHAPFGSEIELGECPRRYEWYGRTPVYRISLGDVLQVPWTWAEKFCGLGSAFIEPAGTCSRRPGGLLMTSQIVFGCKV